jgi:CSLREA domain-containing protein
MHMQSNRSAKGFVRLSQKHKNGITAAVVMLMAWAAASGAVPRNPQLITPAAQSISFSGTDVGETSAPQTQTFTFSSSVTLGSVQVVTQGAPSLDFLRPASDTGSTACKAGASYTSGQSCSVQVIFTPMDPGLRMGAVVLEDNSSPMLVVATAYVSGIGQGADFAFTPAVVSDVAGTVGTNPEGIAVDAEGNLYLADSVDAIIRKVTPGGTVTTVAGGGTGCAAETDSMGDGCAATSATLEEPQYIAIDGAGNIYIGTAEDNTIRRVGLDGSITLFAGGGSGCSAETDQYGDGCPAADAVLSLPVGIAVDGSGAVYINDSGHQELRRVSADGTITGLYLYPDLDSGPGIALDALGDLYFSDGPAGNTDRTLYKLPASSITASAIGTAFMIDTIAVDAAGNVYFSGLSQSSTPSYTIYELPAAGVTSLFKPGSKTALDNNIALDGAGNLYVSNLTSNGVSKFDVATTPQLTFASTPVNSTSSTQTVTVNNIGNLPLVFNTPTSGTNPSYPQEFSADPDATGQCAAGTPVASGQSCSISVEFAPTQTGSPQGNVVLTDNALDAGLGTQTVPVSGVAQPVGTVTINTMPQGLQVSVDGGASLTTPFLVNWQPGSKHTIAAATIENLSGTQYTFSSWSDGGSASHSVTASAAAFLYTATFTQTGYLLTVKPSVGGTISPATGTYYSIDSSVNLSAIAGAGYGFVSWTGNVASTADAGTTILMSAPETVSANFFVIPADKTFVVNTNADDASGLPSNCTGAGTACTLRDALVAALAPGSGTVTFDPTVFAATQPAAARDIMVTNGTLNIGSQTTIVGPTIGSGAGLTQLVTLSGNGTDIPTEITITAAAGVQNAALSGLILAPAPGQSYPDDDGGVANYGDLTVSNTIIANNAALYSGNAGIYNDGTLRLMNSTIAGNASLGIGGVFGPGGGGLVNDTNGKATITGTLFLRNSVYPNSYGGGGITNFGTLSLIESMVYGNEITDGNAEAAQPHGAGILNLGTLTLTSTTVAGNINMSGLDSGGGIDSDILYGGTSAIVVTNSFLAANLSNGVEDECDGAGCPVNGAAGNVLSSIGPQSVLNFAGTSYIVLPPSPGSPAICTGIVADLPPGLTTDERGLPRTTTYGSNPTCLDSGAVQTNYSLSFSRQPAPIAPATAIAPQTDFSAAVNLKESGMPVSGQTIPVSLGHGSTGVLSGGSAVTDSSGVAAYSSLQISSQGENDTLVATLPLTATLQLSSASNAFSVSGQASQTIAFSSVGGPVTYGVGAIALQATASSGLAVSFSVSGPATVSGSTLMIQGAGAVVVTASQAGDAAYDMAAPVSQTITVNKAGRQQYGGRGLGR